MLALKAGELPGPQGQIELFRRYALGNFRNLLIKVARDPAMVVFLDGRTNVRRKPQENFGREIMELFTFGVGNYTEEDVYAAARVFTGWNLRKVTDGRNRDPETYYEFFYNSNQHDTAAKTFTFPIYGNDTLTIPARAAADGMQDGIDFITALALHPETARRLARKLWNFFVSELGAPDPAFVEAVAAEYLRNNTEMRPVVRYILGARRGHPHGRVRNARSATSLFRERVVGGGAGYAGPCGAGQRLRAIGHVSDRRFLAGA